MKFFDKLKQKARKLKSEAQVLMISYKDKRTPITAKILIGITVGYFIKSNRFNTRLYTGFGYAASRF